MSASPPRGRAASASSTTRMFALGRPTEAVIAQAAAARPASAAAGRRAEDRAELARNIELARAIGASGTPTFVVGDQVLQGAVGYEALKDAIAAAAGAAAS